MPVVESLMQSLTAKYGAARGESIYYAMEATARGPFAKGRKYHDLHLAFVERHGLSSISERSPSPAPAKERRARRTSGGRGR